ncbi:hypothetical protein EDD73_108146, partial [Heliophilum fasciatum]
MIRVRPGTQWNQVWYPLKPCFFQINQENSRKPYR